MAVQAIDPIRDGAWDEFVQRTPEATVFHSGAWARVLVETYGFSPRYLVSRDSRGEITGGLPLFAVDTRLAGPRLVALPFSDLCPPLAADGPTGAELLAAARETASAEDRRLEIRGPLPQNAGDNGFRREDGFQQHLVPLETSADELWARLHSSARRAIRKAEREGVKARVSREAADMERFYGLNMMTRRKHGLIPQPWRFFQNIQRQLVERGLGFLLMAEYKGNVIAADLLLTLNETMVYKFNASDVRYLELRPNNLLLWTAIQMAREGGYRYLDLGRCESDNEGLRRFKLLWGSEEVPLPYHFDGPAEEPTAAAGNHSFERWLVSLLAQHAPPLVLRQVSALIYRHFA